jgi:hypothetical protein
VDTLCDDPKVFVDARDAFKSLEVSDSTRGFVDTCRTYERFQDVVDAFLPDYMVFLVYGENGSSPQKFTWPEIAKRIFAGLVGMYRLWSGATEAFPAAVIEADVLQKVDTDSDSTYKRPDWVVTTNRLVHDLVRAKPPRELSVALDIISDSGADVDGSVRAWLSEACRRHGRGVVPHEPKPLDPEVGSTLRRAIARCREPMRSYVGIAVCAATIRDYSSPPRPTHAARRAFSKATIHRISETNALHLSAAYYWLFGHYDPPTKKCSSAALRLALAHWITLGAVWAPVNMYTMTHMSENRKIQTRYTVVPGWSSGMYTDEQKLDVKKAGSKRVRQKKTSSRPKAAAADEDDTKSKSAKKHRS